MNRSRYLLPALSLLLLATVARAQASVSAELAVHTQYQWRGLTMTNRLVVQPSLGVAVPAGTATISAGMFASVDGGRYDGVKEISENGGAGVDLAEYRLFAAASRAFGRATITVGATSYSFPNSAGRRKNWNTYEGYVHAEFDAPFRPSFAVWQDVKQIQGAYAEFGVSQEVGRFSFGGLGGWSFGQSVGDGGALAYFEEHGFTHADLSVRTTFELGAVSATPSGHLIVGGDPFTKRTAPGEQQSTKLYFGMTFSWSHAPGSAGETAKAP